MGRRIDYMDDPKAPASNSLVPSVNSIVVNEQGELLLICRTDSGSWALPGGAVDLGETLRAAAVRETLEETGIECEVTGISGIYTDPKHVIEYTSDGEVRQEFTIVLTARALKGTPTASSESSQVHWVPAGLIDDYQIHPAVRKRIEHYLSGRQTPYLD
jgi:ADP-ribose pyrophosphatase YjhB (NUDIX family)